jgi:hypothetical protein
VDLGSIFLILALALAVVLFVSRPLMERRGKIVSREEHDLSHLLAERERILNTLQELDFDFALGKLPEGEYPKQREELLKSGAEVLRKLDVIQGLAAEKTAEARIEAVIESRRAALGVTATSTLTQAAPSNMIPDDQIETLLAQRRRSRFTNLNAPATETHSAGFCPKCGAPLQKSDRFCSKCGNRI